MDWLYYLAFPLRAARRAVLPLGLLLIAAYFALNAVYSERGYLNMVEKADAVHQARFELDLLEQERHRLEQRVNLLKGEAIGRDLLEEEARRILNVAHRDEVVVQMPPTAHRLYRSGNPPDALPSTAPK
ncbi:MAG TPA: septum formation initiator family protein [Alphaproteobacteria bacterium]|nr:septum formation initiator family protein [Alphaproteobacteria bacterium]